MALTAILVAIGFGCYLVGYLVGRQGNPRQPHEDLSPDELRQCLEAAKRTLQRNMAAGYYQYTGNDEAMIRKYRKRLQRAERNATPTAPTAAYTNNKPWPY